MNNKYLKQLILGITIIIGINIYASSVGNTYIGDASVQEAKVIYQATGVTAVTAKVGDCYEVKDSDRFLYLELISKDGQYLTYRGNYKREKTQLTFIKKQSEIINFRKINCNDLAVLREVGCSAISVKSKIILIGMVIVLAFFNLGFILVIRKLMKKKDS